MTTRKKKTIDFTAYVKQGLTLATFAGAMGYSHVTTNSKIDDKAVAQDTAMRVHWRAERQHKDSLQTASDSIAALKDDFMIRQNDTIIQLLHSHNH